MKRREQRAPRPRRTGNDRLNSLFIALAMLGAVILGLLLPSVTVYIQGRSTDGIERQAELGAGALSLTSDDAKLERLRLFSLCMEMERNGKLVETVQLSDGRFMDAGDAINKLGAVMALTEGSGLPMANFTTADLQIADALLLVTDEGSMATAVLWIVDFLKPTGESLSYVLDDSTGTIIGVSYSYGQSYAMAVDGDTLNMTVSSITERLPESAQAVEALAKNLAACWNFSETQIRAPELNGVEVNPYENVFYLSLSRDGELLLEVPVTIGIDSWSINEN